MPLNGFHVARDDPKMQMEERMSFDTAGEKKDREDLVSLAKPQGGVDAMTGLFPNAKPVPGVTGNGDAATRSTPTFGMPNGQGKPTVRQDAA